MTQHNWWRLLALPTWTNRGGGGITNSHLLRGAGGIHTSLEGRTFRALVAGLLQRGSVRLRGCERKTWDTRGYALCGRSATLGACTKEYEYMWVEYGEARVTYGRLRTSEHTRVTRDRAVDELECRDRKRRQGSLEGLCGRIASRLGQEGVQRGEQRQIVVF
jgi:hypothetical protein